MASIRPLEVRRALTSFDLSLRAQNKSPRTVEVYSLPVRQLADFLGEKGHSGEVSDISRDDLNAYFARLHEKHKPSTVNNRYRGLQAFFKFLDLEEEIPENPMRNMRPPQVPEILVPVLSEADVKSLLRACEGHGFEDRRDHALLRLFVTTGARRAELINLRLSADQPEENDISLDPPTIRVMGKGRRERLVPFDVRTARAVDRYMRMRESHAHAHLPWLWLSRKGRLTANGALQMVRRRGREAGLGKIYVPQPRPTF
ncbi:MAG: phage integrase N-terminal SAM-like domain-containing protein, partial [Chloroflexi bacterium]|nr:phage integrase N-terminal SAM-like domain-containing protein [Chloroflexota bacterium]